MVEEKIQMNIDEFSKKMNAGPMFYLLAGPCVIEGEEMAFEMPKEPIRYANVWEYLTYSKVLLKKPIARVSIRIPV